MNINEVLMTITFITTSILLIIHIIENSTPKLADILSLANTYPCYEIKIYKNGRQLKYEAWIKYINSYVDDYELKDGVLYIQIS